MLFNLPKGAGSRVGLKKSWISVKLTEQLQRRGVEKLASRKAQSRDIAL